MAEQLPGLHAHHRVTGDDVCPTTELVVIMDLCQACPYFRGAVSYPGKRAWSVTCNWPMNYGRVGDLADRPGRDPVPAPFLKAFEA